MPVRENQNALLIQAPGGTANVRVNQVVELIQAPAQTANVRINQAALLLFCPVVTCGLIQLINGGFQDVSGNTLALGYMTLQLSQDAVSCTPAQISSRIRIKVPLDGAGNVAGTINGNLELEPNDGFFSLESGGGFLALSSSSGGSGGYYVWGNDMLTPSGTTYAIRVYNSAGQLAWGPWDVSITGTGTFDCNTLPTGN